MAGQNLARADADEAKAITALDAASPDFPEPRQRISSQRYLLSARKPDTKTCANGLAVFIRYCLVRMKARGWDRLSSFMVLPKPGR